VCYVYDVNIFVIMLVLLVVFGGGGFYAGGPAIGASVLGLMLGLCFFVYLVGGFRRKNS
jgi:hypothetical protein